MLFNSLDFLVFLVPVLVLFYLLPAKRRWILLLIASYFFYAGWKIEYIALILFSTSVDYLATRMIHRTEKRSTRRMWLTFSLISNLGLLTVFKYFHFFFGGAGWVKDLVVTNDTFAHIIYIFEYGIPVGISFYTFQAVSYAIDVYRRKCVPERNFFKFALYVSYFPQLVAGPIERFNHLHPQLFQAVRFHLDNLKSGLRLMLYGYFLKMVIADNLMVLLEPVYNDPHSYDAVSRFAALVFFGIQVYADFFGYSLIALGIAAIMGVKLADNFKTPFFSLSLRSFWTHWHITLSRWFTDYIYIPLGGNKHGRFRWALAIVAVFFISGLWHGASANYIWWGLLHAAYYLLEQFFFPERNNMRLPEKALRWLATFSFVNFTWAVFRSGTMKNAWAFFSGPGTLEMDFDDRWWLIVPFVVFVFSEWKQRNDQRIEAVVATWPQTFRWSWYALLLAFIFMFAGTGSMQFVYFQF
jgi:alginate O-acetyltransferase complex protein AlgI